MSDSPIPPAASAQDLGAVGRGLGEPLSPAAGAALAAREEDDALMQRVAAGDRQAFGRLVERHRDRMVGYLVRLTGDPDRAEDLAQEAFVRLYHSAARYTAQGHLVAYLYRIATNLLRSEERRTRVVRWLSLDLSSEYHADDDGTSAVPERTMLNGELQKRLASELAGMPLRLRIPLVLHEIEDWPLSRIAEVTGAREGTVKSRLSRGRRELRRRLEPYWTGGPR
jgi:RNA polymerase sigma-70 factor (ECF subfamily)